MIGFREAWLRVSRAWARREPTMKRLDVVATVVWLTFLAVVVIGLAMEANAGELGGVWRDF